MPNVRSADLDLSYTDTGGPGDPILLVHGFASTAAVNWVNTLWVRSLEGAGRRVVAFDNRGHGLSSKPYDMAAYDPAVMARDCVAILDHLAIERADVMGYSMGARITAFLAIAEPTRVRSAVLGGLGYHLVDGGGLPQSVDQALEADSIADVSDPLGRMFRRFAEANGGDLRALAACIRGTRRNPSEDDLQSIVCPVLVAVGTADPIAGDAHRLARAIPRAKVLDIPGRDHNSAVGDRLFRSAVLEFLRERA